MTFPLPLHYFSVQIGEALLDSDPKLDPFWKWRCEIPHSLRIRRYTNDILVAMLREDEIVRNKCHPILTLTQSSVPITIRLSRVALRMPEMVELLNQICIHRQTNPRKERLIYDLVKIHRSVHRIVFLNNNRTDCRLENLRELSVELPSDDEPGLDHRLEFK